VRLVGALLAIVAFLSGDGAQLAPSVSLASVSLAPVSLAVQPRAVPLATGAAASGHQTLVVSRHGQDTWSRDAVTGGHPLATIARAIRLARPGDTIVVHHGAYVGPAGYGAVPGRKDAPIRLRSASGERVVIRGTLQLENADYWTVSGIDVTQDPHGPRKEFLVKFDGGTGWQFLDGEVWGTRGVSNMMISGSTKNGIPRHYRIARTCIHDNRATGDVFMNDHQIYLMPGYRSGPGMIERNVFFNTANGAAIKAAGPDSRTGAGRVTVRRNTMVRSAAGVVVGYGSNRITVRDNLIGDQRKHPPAGSAYVRNYDAAMIGNHVRGRSNALVRNAIWDFPRALHSTGDSTQTIRATRTTWADPGFPSHPSCEGLHPKGRAKVFGRYS
jgi:hypothetical protein